MTPERPRWLDRWLQTDDDELLYVDQTIVTPEGLDEVPALPSQDDMAALAVPFHYTEGAGDAEDETLDALEHERLAQAERRTEEARGRLREEWEAWVDTQAEEEEYL